MGRIAGVSPEETKTRLIDAAARLFEQSGFERATVSQIAKEAGVSSGAIYAHYDSKAELLIDALRSHGERATSSLFPPGSRLDIAEVLRTLAARLRDRNPADSALLAESLLAARRDDDLRSVIGDALTERQRLMTEVIEQGQQAGQLAADVSAEAAAQFALMLGLGSMLVSEAGVPPVAQQDWNAFIDRFLSAFIKENTT